MLSHRAEVARILDREDDRLLVVVGPCSVHDVDAALEYAQRLERPSRGAERGPLRRDARLLREAAHDDRLEGPDQRPAPGRQRRRQLGPAHGAPAAAARCSTSACRSAASSSTRSRRSTSPTSSPGERSARARPRARSTASSPRACRCRSASRTAPTATSRSRWTPSAPRRPRTPSPGVETSGTPAIFHTDGNADCHVILRGGRGAPNYDAEGDRRRPWPAARQPACRAADGRRLARQQRQGPRAPAAGGGRDRRPGRRGQRGDRRRDAGVVPGRRAPGARAGRRLVYGQSITDACMDWETTVLALDRLAAAVRKRREAG